jgi:hypothetical protein
VTITSLALSILLLLMPGLTWSVGDKPAFTCRARPGELPRPDIKPDYRRGGSLLPVFTPSVNGVTDDYAPTPRIIAASGSPWKSRRLEDRRYETLPVPRAAACHAADFPGSVCLRLAALSRVAAKGVGGPPVLQTTHPLTGFTGIPDYALLLPIKSGQDLLSRRHSRGHIRRVSVGIGNAQGRGTRWNSSGAA